ncbi:hypothetical protein G3N57_06280 [Paraburkholderia sp. Se-20369]|nr:hypothetical protein [Paraburkholderia sp. Se-20369]
MSGWRNANPFIADVEVSIKNTAVNAWPAIGVRAGNFTPGDDVGEIKGVAYINRFNNNGSCQVVTDPSKPPPPSVAINVTAPDWNLGELPRGDGTKTFASPAGQLCFTYSGTAVGRSKFVINAGNANGVVSNRYLLRNLTDVSQTVPYSMTLDSGTSTLSLPNSNGTALSLSDSGKTCFTPTFKTTVDPSVKAGNYNDVLTFTVVTKS